MQRKRQWLLGSGLALVALGLVCELNLRDRPAWQVAEAAYRQGDCQAAIPHFQRAIGGAADRTANRTGDRANATLGESRYRLAECQRYQAAQAAEQANRLNSAFAQYVRFAKIYPHSTLVSRVRKNLQQLSDRVSPGGLVSPETCQGITLLLNRAVLSSDHPAVPHLLLTCGRLWAQQNQFDRAVHAYAALEIRYPNHYLVRMFGSELEQLLRGGTLARSQLINVYQAIEQQDLNQLNRLAQPEPNPEWLGDGLQALSQLNQLLAGQLGALLMLTGLGLAGWGLWPTKRADRRQPPAQGRSKPAAGGKAANAQSPGLFGLNFTSGQYRLTKRSPDRLHPDRPAHSQAAESPPTAQTTQHLTSTNPTNLHPEPGQYRFDQLDLKRQQRSPAAGQAKRQPPTKNQQPPHSPRPRPAAPPRRRPSRSLEKQLLLMVQQNRPTAERLVNLERSRVPDQSEDWYWQAAIERLLRDRR